MVVSLYGESSVTISETESSEGNLNYLSSNYNLDIRWTIACASKLNQFRYDQRLRIEGNKRLWKSCWLFLLSLH